MGKQNGHHETVSEQEGMDPLYLYEGLGSSCYGFNGGNHMALSKQKGVDPLYLYEFFRF